MSQIAILFRRERAWAAALVIALTVVIVGAVIMNGQNQFAEAAAASAGIASKTIALQTDADGNVKANIGDTVRVSVNVNNTDGGCNAIGVETYVTADMTAYGGAVDEELTCITDNGGTADQFRLDFVIEDAGVVDGIDVAGGHASSAVDVTATDIDDGAGLTDASNNMIVAVDTVAPIVTDGNISISGASGTGGAFKVGDTVTATWDGGESGDDEGAEVTDVTVDFSQFGGGAAVVASADGDFNWTATFEITSGGIDSTNRNVSVTATDNASNDTTTSDTSDATLDNTNPTVTNANISVSGGSGTGGAFRIGDTVTATWNNTAGGDNNSDTISGVTVDFTQFGGGAAVVASDSSGTWTATFGIVAGGIDTTNDNVSVTATDNAGNATTTADTTNATLDNIDPIVTAANIAIDDSACTGGTGECIVGDTMTFTWNGSGEGGDGNTDTFEDVSMDLSNFGGDINATMTDDGEGGDAVAADGVWTVSLTVAEGSIDAAGVSVDGMTVIDNAGNTNNCGASIDTAAIDNNSPTVTDGNISISGASGTGGAYKVGDTVTATWDGGESGDDEGAEVTDVTVDFSQFGGGAAVVASADGDFNWTATYLIAGGAVDTTNRNVSVTATDNTGNDTTTADTTNATVDNVAPTVTDGRISISGASGLVGYKIGDTVTATWNNTNEGDNNSDSFASVTVNFTEFGGGAAVAASNSSGTWTATYAISAGAIDDAGNNVSVTVTDNAGNVTTTSDTTGASVDSIASTLTDGNISISGASGTGGAYKIGDTVTATWDGGESGDNGEGENSSVTVNFSQFGGGSAVAASADGDFNWTATYVIVAGSVDTTNRNVSVTATDNAGNTTTTADTTNATVDNIRPTITNVLAMDADNDGILDGINVSFSESIANAAAAANGFNATSATDHGSCTGESIDPDGSGSAILSFECTLIDTSVGDLTLAFTANAGVVDDVGNQMSSVSLTDESSPSIEDGAQPLLLTVTPADGATSVERDASIVLEFTEAMGDEDYVEGAEFTSDPDPTRWSSSTDAEEHTVTLIHGNDLSCGRVYTIALDDATITDVNGNDLDLADSIISGEWSFTSKRCSSGGGGGGSSSSSSSSSSGSTTTTTTTDDTTTTDNSNTETVDLYTDDHHDEIDGLTTDSEGRDWAPDSSEDGASPYDGSTQTISEVLPGELIRSEHYNSVYYVTSDMTRRPFWDSQTYFTWAGTWDDVVWVTDATLATLTLDHPMLPKAGVVLVKIQSDPKVYAVDEATDGSYTKHWIPDESTAIALYGSAWADYVVDVESTVMHWYDDGDDMSVSDSVDTSVMKTRAAIAALMAGI